MPICAETLSVAVASNFAAPAKILAEKFEEISGENVQISLGSSGKLYAQILNGAPFDVFLSADVEKPAELVKNGKASGQFTYAFGRLALWSNASGLDVKMLLEKGDFDHLALANPKLAPYGNVALEVLETLKLSKNLEAKFVRGENISQAYQFVDTGNAELGFVALSQVILSGKITKGSAWIVPADMHSPIAQDAVMVRDNEAARAFMAYLQSDAARAVILSFGYEISP